MCALMIHRRRNVSSPIVHERIVSRRNITDGVDYPSDIHQQLWDQQAAINALGESTLENELAFSFLYQITQPRMLETARGKRGVEVVQRELPTLHAIINKLHSRSVDQTLYTLTVQWICVALIIPDTITRAVRQWFPRNTSPTPLLDEIANVIGIAVAPVGYHINPDIIQARTMTSAIINTIRGCENVRDVDKVNMITFSARSFATILVREVIEWHKKHEYPPLIHALSPFMSFIEQHGVDALHQSIDQRSVGA